MFRCGQELKPQSSTITHYKNDWYSTSCTVNIMCKDNLRNSKIRQESSCVDWWPCATLGYGLWPLETSKWTKPNIAASFAQWSKDAGLRNQTVLSKNKILSSEKSVRLSTRLTASIFNACKSESDECRQHIQNASLTLKIPNLVFYP